MKMHRFLLFVLVLILTIGFCTSVYAAAAEDNPANATDSTGSKAIAAAIVTGIAAGAGAIGMGISTGKAYESIARQPDAEDKIRGSMFLGLIFIETAIIYALVVAILVIFVL
jgi:F-type H+-transporting ATPase subunit c